MRPGWLCETKSDDVGIPVEIQQLVFSPRGHLLGVQLSIPGEYVKPLDLVDQNEDCATRRGDLVPRVALKALTPGPQDTEFLRVQFASLHPADTTAVAVGVMTCKSGAVSVTSAEPPRVATCSVAIEAVRSLLVGRRRASRAQCSEVLRGLL